MTWRHRRTDAGACTPVFSPFVEIEPEEYRRVTEVDYLGHVHPRMTPLRQMRPRDHGTAVGAAMPRRKALR